MALPSYFGSGTFGSSTTTLVPTFPASTLAGDIAFLVIESENQAVTLSSAQGFCAVTNSPQGTGTAGTAGSTRLTVFWKRLVGGDTAPTIADPGDHITAQIHVFRGCKDAEQLAADLFDRANNADLGANWAVVGGSMQIVGNQVRPGSTGADCAERNTDITWPADQWASVVIKARPAGSGEGSGPAVRLSSSAFTGYLCQCNATTGQLYRFVAGAGTSLGTFAAPAVGATVRLEAVGTSIRVLVNGVIVFTVVDTQITSGSGGVFGFESSAGTAEIDSFTGGAMNPWHLTAGAVDAVSDVSAACPTLTTTVADCLVVLLYSTSADSTSTVNFSAQTNAALASLTERTDNTNLIGLGGGHGMTTGTKAVAGAVGTTAVTYSAASLKGLMTIALQGASSAFTGSGALNVIVPVLAAVGVLSFIGSAAMAVPQPSVAGTGAHFVNITGTAALTVTKPVFAGTGVMGFTGSAALAVTKPVFAGTGTQFFNVTATGALGVTPPTFAGTGSVNVVVSGTMAQTVPKPSVAGVGSEGFAGSGALTVTKPSLAGVGLPQGYTATGALGVTLPTFAGVGVETFSGVGALLVPTPFLEGGQSVIIRAPSRSTATISLQRSHAATISTGRHSGTSVMDTYTCDNATGTCDSTVHTADAAPMVS